MKNKHLLFSLVIFSICFYPAYSQIWTLQNSGTTQDLTDVYFFNNTLGCACSDSGIYKTSDGGDSWNKVFSATGLIKLHFPTSTTGYASAMANAGLYKTTDSGNTWTSISLNLQNYNGGGIWFTSADTGFYAVGNFSTSSKILKTADGGATWDTVFADTTSGWISFFHFPDANNGYATGNNGYVYKTNDGGNTWSSIYMGGNYWMSGVYFFDGNTGFVSGGNMSGGTHPIWKTTDGGANWQILLSITGGSGISRIEFSDPSNGYAIKASQTGNGNLLSTYNSGVNWVNVTTPGDSLRAIHFPTPNTGYAVGKSGTIIKTFTSYLVSGTIFKKDSSGTINNGKVYLIEFDTAAIQLTYVDSFDLNGTTGDYYFFDRPAGNYLVLLRPDDSAYPNTIPTYYGDTAYWGYAEILNLLSDTAGVDIYTRQTPVWMGTGFCSGSIRYGLGSGKTGNGNVVPFGDPVPGIDISLEQIPGGIIKAHTTTNDSGFYSINNIPMNTSYKLLVDIPGLPMDSTYSIIINPSDSVITDLDFVVDTSAGTAGVYIGYPLGIKSQISNLRSQISIYPNPNNGKFEVLSSGTGSLHIEVYTTTGQLIFKSNSKNSQQVIDISNQPAGTYFLKVKSDGLLWVGKVHRE